MMVKLYADELYPFYFLFDNESDYAVECAVLEETLKRWRRIESEFGTMQREMQDAYMQVTGCED